MKRKTIILLALGLAISVAAFTASATGTWTADDGYVIGCSLGSSETYEGENLDAYEATMEFAEAEGQIFYMYGVEEGYLQCRFIDNSDENPWFGGGGRGGWDIKGVK